MRAEHDIYFFAYEDGEQLLYKITLEDDDEEEIADYDKSSSVTGMRYIDDNQMMVSFVPNDPSKNNEVLLIDLETGKDKRVYKTKREDGELFMIDINLDRSRSLGK